MREVFQPINTEARIELECHHFAIPNELTNLGTEHQWLLTSQKETTRHYILLNGQAYYEIILPKNLNLNLIKLLDLSIFVKYKRRIC